MNPLNIYAIITRIQRFMYLIYDHEIIHESFKIYAIITSIF